MESVRRLARQVRPRRVAHALFARHARRDHRRAATWFAQSGHAGSFERYVVRLYLAAWVTALVSGAIATATRTTPLRAVVAGGATVGVVRLLAVQVGMTRLWVARWRTRRELDRATPHAVVTLRRCVAGTTDRRRLLAAVATATDGPATTAFSQLHQRTELEGVESALRATARATPSPAFAALCRALCGPETGLAGRLDALDVTPQRRGRIGRLIAAMGATLRTGTRPLTRRQRGEQCEAFLDAVAAELRAGVPLSRAAGRAATTGEFDAIRPAIERFAASLAVGTPTATRLAFEQFAAAISAPESRHELRRVAAALACDCPPTAAIAGPRSRADDETREATAATAPGERQRS
ncbi:hypothetical protein BRC71_00645 [Halobacteriales archaeon QH_7_65_31]|nr:MAG: hypothetical protein BRC71_00645 [Halobacteriales archaeon QH_7_65_31]